MGIPKDNVQAYSIVLSKTLSWNALRCESTICYSLVLCFFLLSLFLLFLISLDIFFTKQGHGHGMNCFHRRKLTCPVDPELLRFDFWSEPSLAAQGQVWVKGDRF